MHQQGSKVCIVVCSHWQLATASKATVLNVMAGILLLIYINKLYLITYWNHCASSYYFKSTWQW